MPILHVQFAGEAQKHGGGTIQLPAPQALQIRGPVLQISVSLEQSFADALAKQGKALPNPVSGVGLIDTGASDTCIDDETAQELQLPVIDVCNMTSASHAATQQNVYPVQIQVVGFPIRVNVPRCIGANLKPQGLLLLIGRDFLQHGTLIYNGMAGEITFAV